MSAADEIRLQPELMTTRLETWCSWCRKRQRIRVLPWNGKEVDKTHTICKPCYDAKFDGEED